MNRRRAHFSFMGAYWSCSYKAWLELCLAADLGEPIELPPGCRRLKCKPKGDVPRLWSNPRQTLS